MSSLIIVAFILIALGFVILAAVDDRICTELRSCHGAVWQAIGSPNRVLDDFGFSRYYALQNLYRRPELLSQCGAALLRRIKFRRFAARMYLGFVSGLLVVGGLHYFGKVL
jgi:hypothetical protein